MKFSFQYVSTLWIRIILKYLTSTLVKTKTIKCTITSCVVDFACRTYVRAMSSQSARAGHTTSCTTILELNSYSMEKNYH